MLELDFTINSAIDRTDYVNNFVKLNPLYKFSSHELETISNYLLFGKDASGYSPVDRKLIQIDTKYSSYKKKAPESLEELTENPAFNEASIPQTPIRTKTPKFKIDRCADADVPGLPQLWEEIDRLAHIIAVSEHKEVDESVKILDSRSLYHAKHQLIELRREQYFLRDSAKPTLSFNLAANKGEYRGADPAIPWDQPSTQYSIAPLGVITTSPQRFLNPTFISEHDYHYNESALYKLDFRNKEHIYYLMESWTDLETLRALDCESTADGILETLNFYIKKANLNDSKSLILEMKINKKSNEEIGKQLSEKYGLNYSLNYISTIWKQKICGEIANAATLHFDEYMERENAFAWKKCNQCGRTMLRDTRNFMRKAKSSDGLAPKCKDCCKENRDK